MALQGQVLSAAADADWDPCGEKSSLHNWKPAYPKHRQPTTLLPCRTSRKWHFFVKYWIVCAGSLTVIFPLSADIPSIRAWSPLCAFLVLEAESRLTFMWHLCLRR